MCSPYFRQFPELPAEIRLQIWQEACLAFAPSQRGLHYVTVQDNKAVALPCSWPTWPRSLSQRTNRSAYFINGGLWKACKESREVIARYTGYYKWLEIHEKAIQDSRELVYPELVRRQPSSGHGPPPAIIDYNGEGGEECRMLVYPSRDMFCIKVDDWHSIRPARHPDLQMPFIRVDEGNYAERLLHDRYELLFEQPSLQEIALEFDPSWAIDVPYSISQMADENSARGYLANWLIGNVDHWHYAEGLSIIDKEAKWVADGSKYSKTAYRDFDTEYVKVSWYDILDHTRDGISPSSLVFLEKIHNYEHYLYTDAQSRYGWLGGRGPDIENVISVLVRRDNEVKDDK
ncbi:uncharacterized protein B0J16DRAFT_419256 [Fusarium flagelliforme]|uniref:uncharacterized protein n=1 Tax=Fusarium flagelliforme TaxID=2675880 RepID=UPI001E8CD36B|nr:uncharacterized protein B0J16DRAFT_419256 [Fusarium flagelliforme]KAH7174041.1 hypothetical protein B0J16DRAFT_419256 [Fusarium flagelliforme]